MLSGLACSPSLPGHPDQMLLTANRGVCIGETGGKAFNTSSLYKKPASKIAPQTISLYQCPYCLLQSNMVRLTLALDSTSLPTLVECYICIHTCTHYAAEQLRWLIELYELASPMFCITVLLYNYM